MNEFAEFVENPNVKKELMELILTDYETCLDTIGEIMGDSIEVRRSSKLENNKLRNNSLKALHKIQIECLTKWRNIEENNIEESDKYLLELLLLVNALSGGLKGTG